MGQSYDQHFPFHHLDEFNLETLNQVQVYRYRLFDGTLASG
jgi:hypothetical protein